MAVVAAALVAAAVVVPVAGPGADAAVAAPDLTLSLPLAPRSTGVTASGNSAPEAAGPPEALHLPPRTVVGVPAGPAPADAAPADLPADADPADLPAVDADVTVAAPTVATSTVASRTSGNEADAHSTDEPSGNPARSRPLPGTAPGPALDAPVRAATAPTGEAHLAPGTVTGTLVRLWVEPHVAGGADPTPAAVGEDEDDGHDDGHDDGPGSGTDGAAASLQAWVESPDRAYRVSPTDVVGVEDGSTVTVDLDVRPAADAPHPVLQLVEVAPAQQVEGAVTFGEGSTDLFGAAAATVLHDVTVVLAIPRGAVRDSTSRAAVAASVNGGVNTFWRQQSRGQRGVRVVAQHGWVALTRDCSKPTELWSEVASKVGWKAGARRHLLVYLPASAGCGAGLGTVGSGPDAGGRSWVSLNTVPIIAHELGHNLGLGHSDGLLCTGRSDGTWTGSGWQSGCRTYDYRDYYDVMGVSWSHLGSLGAPHADALGLLRSTEKLVTSQPVRVRLVPASSDGLRVLRVDDPAGVYYVEYRPASGWDAWLSGNYRGLDAGVIVRRRALTDARRTLLLDGSVTSGTRDGDWRSALRPGASMTTSSGVTRITVESQTASGATLVVHRNGVGPATVVPPSGGAQVEIRTPVGGAAASGTTVFSGVGTAPEGTLMWEVVQGGTVKASGTAQTGANGTFDTFQVPVALPAGTFTFRVWVPDESSGEGVVDRSRLRDETSVKLS